MNNDASEKTSWERMIKQNMVPLKVDGSQSTYVLDDKKNSAVEIHFGTRYLIPPRQLSKVEPAVARAAGFPRPILHGLGTLGVAGHALLKCCCGYDPAKFRSLRLRFSAPVYPGETIRMEMWKNGAVVSFRARVVERDIIVLNNGYAEIG